MPGLCRCLWVAALVLSACGNNEEGPTAPAWFGEAEIPWVEDGAPGVAAPVGVTIQRGELPDLGACPEGWTPVQPTDHAVMACEPWPEGPQECEDFQVHRPGTPGCVDLGSPCTQDGWPAELPDVGVVYVRPGASGDGTRQAPFGTLIEALGSRADVIALSAGVHEAGVEVERPVSLIGACPSQTRLTMKGLCDDRATVSIRADVTLRDLSIVDADCSGVVVESGTTTVRDVAVLDSGLIGVAGNGGTIEVQGLLTRRLGGYGLAAIGPATIRAQDVTVVASTAASVVSANGGDVSITGAVLQDPVPDEGDGFRGYNAVAYSGRLDLQRPVLEGGQITSALAQGGTLQIEDALVRGLPGSGGRLPVAVSGYGSSDVTVRRLFADRAVGVVANDSTVSAQDVLAADATLALAMEDGSVTVERVANGGRAWLLGSNSGGRLEARDFSCQGEYCASVAQGASLTLIEGQLDRGLGVADGADITLEDVTFSVPRPTFALAGAVTLRRAQVFGELDLGGDAVLEDVWVQSGRTGSALTHAGPSLSAERLAVEGLGPALVRLDADQAVLTDVRLSGGGLYVTGGEASVERMVVRQSSELGAGNLLGSTLSLTDVALLDPLPGDCADCPLSGFFSGGEAHLTRVLVDGGGPDALISGGHVTCQDVLTTGQTALQGTGRLSGERCQTELTDIPDVPAPSGFEEE